LQEHTHTHIIHTHTHTHTHTQTHIYVHTHTHTHTQTHTQTHTHTHTHTHTQHKEFLQRESPKSNACLEVRKGVGRFCPVETQSGIQGREHWSVSSLPLISRRPLITSVCMVSGDCVNWTLLSSPSLSLSLSLSHSLS